MAKRKGLEEISEWGRVKKGNRTKKGKRKMEHRAKSRQNQMEEIKEKGKTAREENGENHPNC